MFVCVCVWCIIIEIILYNHVLYVLNHKTMSIIDNYHDKCHIRNTKTICIMCDASMVMLKHECISMR